MAVLCCSLQVDAEVGWCKAKMSSNGKAEPRFQPRFSGVSHASVRRVSPAQVRSSTPPPHARSFPLSHQSLFPMSCLSFPFSLLLSLVLDSARFSSSLDGPPHTCPSQQMPCSSDCGPCSEIDEIMSTPEIPSTPAMLFLFLPSSFFPRPSSPSSCYELTQYPQWDQPACGVKLE